MVPTLVVIAVIAMIILAYMKNKTANRREDRRTRYWQRQQDLLDQLKENKKDDE